MGKIDKSYEFQVASWKDRAAGTGSSAIPAGGKLKKIL